MGVDGVQLRCAAAYQRDDTQEVDSVEIIVRGRHSEIDRGEAKVGDDLRGPRVVLEREQTLRACACLLYTSLNARIAQLAGHGGRRLDVHAQACGHWGHVLHRLAQHV